MTPPCCTIIVLKYEHVVVGELNVLLTPSQQCHVIHYNIATSLNFKDVIETICFPLIHFALETYLTVINQDNNLLDLNFGD